MWSWYTCRRGSERRPDGVQAFHLVSVTRGSIPLPPPPNARDIASAQWNLETALYARSGHHRLVPPLDVRKVRQVDLMALVPPCPAEDSEIGDRDIAPGEFDFGQPLVEHAVEPAGLFRIALEAIASVLLVGNLQEVVHLTGHRTKAAHLPHQPFEHRYLAAQIRGPVFAGLLAEINQDRSRFEDADRLAARPPRIDDRGNLAIGTDLDESGGELLAFGDVDRLYGVRQAHLFEGYTDLAAVRRIPGVKFDAHRDRPLLPQLFASPAGDQRTRITAIAWAFKRQSSARDTKQVRTLGRNAFEERDVLVRLEEPRDPLVSRAMLPGNNVRAVDFAG